MTRRTLQSDDRAVSIAVTHVLTIGITTILITGLLVGGSGLLETEKDRATRTELRTIGNRMASEISSTYYSGQDSGSGSVVVQVSHPQYVAGDNYKVRIEEAPNCNGPAIPNSGDAQCLVLWTPGGGGDEVFVPLDPDISLDDDDPLPEVSGGSFYIIVEELDDGDPAGDPEVDVTLSNDPTPSLAPMPEVRR